MKKAMILSVIMLAICASYSFAQRGQGQREKLEPEEMAKRQTTQMKESLDLTEEQLTKVEALNLKYAEKMETLRDEAKADREATRNAMKPIREEKDAELKALLTTEQYEKLVTLRKDSQPKRGKGRGRGKS